MSRKISQEAMKERIKKGTYYLMITDYMENNKVVVEYELCSGSGNNYGNKTGAFITEERANEWMALGIETLDYRNY